ncbi:DUF1656 domain-containing protein [Pseudomonas qingdaonensis]|nr:DUF1656 domain-containing protein [Pseudomonas qingdaonensis]
MPREIAFHGLYMPTMTLMFLFAAGLAWGWTGSLPGMTATVFFWHPALLRLCLFICLFGAMALTVYR